MCFAEKYWAYYNQRMILGFFIREPGRDKKRDGTIFDFFFFICRFFQSKRDK